MPRHHLSRKSRPRRELNASQNASHVRTGGVVERDDMALAESVADVERQAILGLPAQACIPDREARRVPGARIAACWL